MEHQIYVFTLIMTGALNLLIAMFLIKDNKIYREQKIYYRTRILTIIWLISFGFGYFAHAICQWRYTWPTAASALSVSYFHIGAICFSWGYTPLLNSKYLSRKIVIRDSLFLLFGLVTYWTVAFLKTYAPLYTMISFLFFFLYAVYITYNFYETYNRVSYRRIKMGEGSVGGFVQWMQICCDLIVLFGICSVAITAIFPTDILPFCLLLVAGVGMFGYIAYSLDKYGPVIKPNTFTFKSVVPLILFTALLTTSCSQNHIQQEKITKADSLITAAYQAHDYDRLITLTDTLEATHSLPDMKIYYWRGYAYSRKRQMRLAENYWQKAIDLPRQTMEDNEYYAKSANRLSGQLLLKSEYEATMRIAIPAMQMMEKEGLDDCDDYAYLLTTIGCCQLNLKRETEAAVSFAKAEEKYIHIINNDNNIKNYTSAIIGVITITENYLQQKHFAEANAWTRHFEDLLERYKKLPNAKPEFIDKQWARLNLYRACALEGLGYHAEAANAYKDALMTNYSKTGDGKLEATTYLVSAKRWKEAADNYTTLNQQIERYNMDFTLDNIQHYLIPKYRANIGANRQDSAFATGIQICNKLDSAIIKMKQDESNELAAVYNIQQKESEIIQQKVNIARQRLITVVIVLILVVAFFIVFITSRHRAARRLEIAFYELEIANAKAKESSRMKTAFIQQISHEIRTPLNILSGFTQILTGTNIELDKETRDEINQKITENTNRITSLVNKMLELSDVNSRTVIERKDNIPVLQIAAQAAEDSMITTASNLHFDIQMEDEMEELMILTSLDHAVRALSLILDNAKKYTKEGTVLLKMAKDKLNVYFTVEDTGIGIPANKAEYIFEEFVQLDEYNEGTGIGLTVARSICHRLGGEIELDTSYTTGARFVMSLPL